MLKINYRNPKAFQTYLTTHNLRNGFYINKQHIIRYLYKIKQLDENTILFYYIPQQQAIRYLTNQTNNFCIKVINIKDDCNIAKWFINAEYLGETLT